MDISAATGKDLESVTNAVGRAYEGSTTALSRLGVGLGATDIKALGLEGTMAALNEKFGGAAQAQAETFQGKMDRLKVAFDETKETVGAALLPVLTEMFDFVTRNLVPIFEKLADDFNKNVRPQFEKLWEIIKRDVLPIFVALGNFIFKELVPTYRDFLKPIIEQIIGIFERLVERVKANKDTFDSLGQTLDKIWFFIKNYIIPLFSFLIEQKLKELERSFQAIVAVLDFVIQKFEYIRWLIPGLNAILTLTEVAWEKTGAAAAYAAEENQGLADQYRDFNNQASSKYIPTIDNFSSSFDSLTGSTGSATSATKSFSAATEESTKAIEKQLTALQTLDLMRAGFAGAIGGVLQPGSAQIRGQLPGGETFRSAAEIVGQFGGLIPGFNAKPGDPYYGFTKGDTIGSFVRPGTTGNTNVTINVNATVADPEGVARAISDVLVGSSGRAGNVILTPVLGFE
jgi:RNAse (barnase) inhibitor barstar